jgi:hypothetical protein
MAGWHFVGVPKKESAEIKAGVKRKAGFGSIPVTVTLGTTVWKTSIFPDKKSGCYLLPLKAKVRNTEEVLACDSVLFKIKLL